MNNAREGTSEAFGATLAAASAVPRLASIWRLARDTRETGIVIALLIAIVFFSFATGSFWRLDTAWSVASSSAISIPIAAGMTAVILARQIDLSVGATLGVAAYAVGTLLDAGVHPIIALLVSVAIGIVLGAVNGLVVTRLKVPAIITTLGTATIYRGILFLAAPHFLGFQINADQIPSAFRALSRIPVLGMPLTMLIAGTVAVLIGLVLAYTPWGRSLYAIGSNPDAARFAGISADRSVFAALTLVGATAGLAGFLYVMRYASVTVRAGLGMDFEVISAVVIGGVAIFGGVGRVLGAILGVIVLNTLSRGFVLMNMPEFWKVVATGVAIIAAVSVDATIARRRARRIRMSRRLREADAGEAA
jgi:rhamnose transport system permease protein